MSRREDFDNSTFKYCNDCKELGRNINLNMVNDYQAGAEYGYQYAKSKLIDILEYELDFNVLEFDDSVTTTSLINKICKRMEG